MVRLRLLRLLHYWLRIMLTLLQIRLFESLVLKVFLLTHTKALGNQRKAST